jgi:hypothetical protein
MKTFKSGGDGMKSFISSSCKFFICIMVCIVLQLSIAVAGPLGSLVDDFEYNPASDPPTDHGWTVISGTGSVSTIEVPGGMAGENSTGHAMHAVSTSGLGYILEYPDSSDLAISSPYFVTITKSDSLYVLELYMAVSKVGQGQQTRHLRYWPENGTSFVAGDTLNIYIGSLYKDGNWHTFSRYLNADVQSLDSTLTFSNLKRVLVKGSLDIDDIMLWERNRIEGYADKISYTQGDIAYIRASLGQETNDTLEFDYVVYRYGGTTQQYASGTGYAHYNDVDTSKPHDMTNPNSPYEPWDVTFDVSIQRNWPSGFYAVRMTLGDPYYSFVPFVVKEDTPGVSSNIVFQTASTNWQAYNIFGGSSFYDGRTPPPGGRDSLSYNRPFNELNFFPGHGYSYFEYPPWSPSSDGIVDSVGAGQFFWWEYYLAHWLESNGYTVEYCDNADIDYWFSRQQQQNDLLKYQLYISCGHDEYWSPDMRKNVEIDFRNSGTAEAVKNLAFFSGNTAFRKISFNEPGGRMIKMTNSSENTPEEYWHYNFVSDTNPGPEERMMGSRTVAETGYNTCAYDPMNLAFVDTFSNPMLPQNWIFEDVQWDQNHTFGRGRLFLNRNNNHRECSPTTEGFLDIAGYEVQGRENVINDDTCPYIAPQGLDTSDIKILASYTGPPYNNTAQMTYFRYPPNPDSAKHYEVFSSGGIQWSWGLTMPPDSVDPAGRTPKITRNIINELARIRVSGTIAQNTTWRSNVDVTGTVTVNTGVTLRLNPGIKVRFAPGTQIIVNGMLAAIGTSADSIKFISNALSPSPGDWYRIYLGTNASCSLSYCAVMYAEYGIEAMDSTHSTILNSNISNNEILGIYNHRGYLTLKNSTLNNDSLAGVWGYYSDNDIYGCNFKDDRIYGIHLISYLSSDSSYVRYDTLGQTTNFTGSQYGIYISGADKVNVYKCKSKRYGQGGLYLNDSNALVTHNDFSGNSSYAIYVDNYSFPKIRYCRLDTTKTGVNTYNSKPDLGIDASASGSGNCSFLNCSKYYIYHSYNPVILDSLKAVNNYYEVTSSPIPSKFKWVYNSSPIKWNPYLSSPPPNPKLDTGPEIPLSFALRQNYPNPFNPATSISFALETPAQTIVTVYNILGQTVTTLVNGYLPPGEHAVIWDGTNARAIPVSSGIYFYTIRSGDHFQSKKMTLLR